MREHYCCIGHPWIIELLIKYTKKCVKYEAVAAQVVEFVKMPDSSSDASYCSTAAVVHISDRKCYIRGVITVEAQEILEREEEHFSLCDIKNKMIILKDYSVGFAESEDLNSCEFFLTVKHFTLLPMETDSVDLLNCNYNLAVRKMIKELWQNYMEVQAANALPADVYSSEPSLTQLLEIACETKLSALKALAEQCLDINPPDNQETPNALTKWGAKRRKNKDVKTFSVPMTLLLIPQHEETALEHMAAFTNADMESDLEDGVIDICSGKEPSSPTYSTALSTQSEEYFDDAPGTQPVNPWNKLQSLCLTTSLTSQAKAASSETPQGSDQDTPVSLETRASQLNEKQLIEPSIPTTFKIQQQRSPLAISEGHSSHDPTEENTDVICKRKTALRDSVVSSFALTCGQKALNVTDISLKLQPHTNLAIGSVSISPIKQQNSTTLGNHEILSPICLLDSESESPRKMRYSNCSPETGKGVLNESKALKRKQFSEDTDTSLPDIYLPGGQDKLFQRRENEKIFSSTYLVEGDFITDMCDRSSISQKSKRKTIAPITNMATKLKVQEEVITKNTTLSQKIYKKCLRKKKHLHKFNQKSVLSTSTSSEEEREVEIRTASRTIINKSTSVPNEEPNLLAKRNKIKPLLDFSNTTLVHSDGTPFQYKYKTPSSSELYACVDSIRLPADLYEWARKILSKPMNRTL